MKYYIASCVFTEKHPALSDKIQAYARRRGMSVVRCCVPGYKVHEFEARMHAAYRGNWQALPHCADFGPGDAVYSICHNCLNIIEETKSAVGVFSIWEAIAADPDFDFPNFHGRQAVLQDCWRSRKRPDEQEAVRSILDKMHVRWTEAPKAREQTDFCGNSLYRPQPPRNPRLAPTHYAPGILPANLNLIARKSSGPLCRITAKFSETRRSSAIVIIASRACKTAAPMGFIWLSGCFEACSLKKNVSREAFFFCAMRRLNRGSAGG